MARSPLMGPQFVWIVELAYRIVASNRKSLSRVIRPTDSFPRS